VDGENERLFRALEECVEFAKNYTFELTADYLALIERVEAMPRNQSGADKSGRWLGSRADADAQHARVKPLPDHR
jgi:hypothetical protein